MRTGSAELDGLVGLRLREQESPQPVRVSKQKRFAFSVTSPSAAEWISAMYPPGNCTIAEFRPSAEYGPGQDRHARGLRFPESIGQIRDLISGHLAAIRIRKMAVGNEHCHRAKD